MKTKIIVWASMYVLKMEPKVFSTGSEITINLGQKLPIRIKKAKKLE